jgi:hypothetical protein
MRTCVGGGGTCVRVCRKLKERPWHNKRAVEPSKEERVLPSQQDEIHLINQLKRKRLLHLMTINTNKIPILHPGYGCFLYHYHNRKGIACSYGIHC